MSSSNIGSVVPNRAMIDAHLAKLRSQPSFYERHPGAVTRDPVSDDDDPVYIDNFYHTMSRKERDLYNKQVHESDGFDVQEFPGAIDLGIIIPALRDEDQTIVRSCANLAIEQHNEKLGENLELVGIVKWNIQGACPVNYYITFKAKDADTGEEGTYQAKVNSRLRDEDTYVDIPLRRASKRKEPPSGGDDDESGKASGSSTHRHCCC